MDKHQYWPRQRRRSRVTQRSPGFWGRVLADSLVGIFASAVKLQRIDSGGRLRTMYIDWAPSSEIRDTCQFFKVSILDARYPVTTA